MSGYRLKDSGIYIDTAQELRFEFDGKKYVGYQGDTLASALLANGVTLFARSFKYHRPRGVYTAGPEEPNALVSLRTGDRHEPNCHATTVELYDGLVARSQNAWPSLNTDFMAVNQFFAPLLIAGFYYKTFMGTGQKFWHFCEHFIRRAAGMGQGGLSADPDKYEKTNHFTDVFIIGGGPAGLLAADTLAKIGAKITLVEESNNWGGSLSEEEGLINGEPALYWANNVVKILTKNEKVTVLPRTTVYGYFDDNTLGAIERVSDHKQMPKNNEPRQRHHKIFAKRVIIATGSVERPIVFEGNDIPGVMLANSALRYAKRYGVAVGNKVVVFTNNDDGYHSAIELKKMGVNIIAMVDPRSTLDPELKTQIEEQNIEHHPGCMVTSAKGGKSLNHVNIAHFSRDSGSSGSLQRINADVLLIAGGYTPTINLCSQIGTKADFVEEIQSFVPGESTQPFVACGAAKGQLDLESTLCGAVEAAVQTAKYLNLDIDTHPSIKVEKANRKAIPFPLTDIPSTNSSAKKFIDLQHDVTVNDLKIAHREGFSSVEHLKRYTTMGMAADQGKTSNMNALALIAKERGISIPEAGTTSFRAPSKPVALGALAGRDVGNHYHALRRTPVHEWHIKNGAEMVDTGGWHRPRVYKKAGESLFEAYSREAKAVRNNVGIVDVTSLGKIDVQGPDAAEFLDRVYANSFQKLPVGKAKYGIMLRDDGYIFDDGTVWRLGETQFLMTTTTVNAARVLSELERLLSLYWPELKVHVSSQSDQWAGMAVAGPKSRSVLESIITDMSFSEEDCPVMSVRKGRIGKWPVMVARLSFSGERAYEILTPRNYGLDVWEAIMDAGKPFGITPYGTESMGALRIEKGHIGGPEMDGRTTLGDVGMERLSSKKGSYIGSVLKNRHGLKSDDRKTMVGLISDGIKPLRPGSVVLKNNEIVGHVTSATFSPILDKNIALALVRKGKKHIGENLQVVFPLKDEAYNVRVVDPCFYDAEGKQLYA